MLSGTQGTVITACGCTANGSTCRTHQL
jgi:hypothetical protein